MNRLLLALISIILVVAVITIFAYPENKKGSLDDEVINGVIPGWSPYCASQNYHVLCDYEVCPCISFWRGECCQEFTLCEQNGYTIENRNEIMGTYNVSYSVCVFDDGTECYEDDYFLGECNLGQCQRWSMPEGGCINN
jgi:putative hemolysin